MVPVESIHERQVAMTENNHDQDSEKTAKAYEAPKVMRVSLRPDEAVLGHCKVPQSRGPAASGCGVATGGCSSFGS